MKSKRVRRPNMEDMKAGLYLVGTPIGNLGDISARGLQTLRQADWVLAEDTRHTHILLERHGIRCRLVSCHQFNEASRCERVVKAIQAGEAVALTTNAGMPGVSDPGARVVRACRTAGLPVTAIPGPSAVTTALALSGFVAGGFLFAGFLPRRAGARRRAITGLAGEPLPVVLLESPYRCLALLAEMQAVMPEREVFIGRELTKLHEECLWGTVDSLMQLLHGRHGRAGAPALRGELTLVLGPLGNAPAARTREETA